MNEEIRNFQVNILLDNVKQLEQENEQLKTRLKLYIKAYKIIQEIKEIAKNNMIGCFSDKCDLANEILQKITKGE